MPNVFSSDSAIYAAVGCTSYLSLCAHQVVGDWGRQLVSLSPANNKFLASLGLLLSSPRSVPSLLELHHFFLLLPRPPIGCRSSSCCASIPSANATGAHARTRPLPSSPLLPHLRPGRCPCVRRAATATSIKEQQCARLISLLPLRRI